MGYTCPKCGKPCWKPDVVSIRGKDPTKTWYYTRYRHKKRYGRYPVHYVPFKGENAARKEAPA